MSEGNGNGAGGGTTPAERLAQLRAEIHKIDGEMARIRNQRVRLARERDHLVKTYSNTPGVTNPSRDQFYVKREDVRERLREYFQHWPESSKVELAYRAEVNVRTVSRIMSENGDGIAYVTLRVADKLLTAVGSERDVTLLQWYTEEGVGINRRKEPFEAWRERQEQLERLAGY